MKNKHIILALFLIMLTNCENKKEKKVILQNKKEIEVKKQALKRTDSLLYSEALFLYKNRNWEKSIEKFKEINSTNPYLTNSKEYIKKIQNRPWRKTSAEGITTSLEGKFSNSATKDSPIWVEMTVYNINRIYLNIYEYSTSKPSDKPSKKPSYNFSLYVNGEYLCRNVRPQNFYGIDKASHTEGIVFSSGLAKKMINKIKNAKNWCSISIDMGSSSTYSFSVDAIFFKKEFNSL